jgi:hypothetical protein
VKNWIKNWLGINALALTVTTVRKDYDKLSTQVDELEATDLSDVESRLDDVEEKCNDIDPDDFVRSNDLDDQIDMWMSNSDFCNEDKVNELINENAEELSDRVEEMVKDSLENEVIECNRPSNEELKELIKVVLEEMVKKLAEAK